MIDDILDMARFENEEMKLNYSWGNLRYMFKSLRRTYNVKAKLKELLFEIIAPETMCDMYIDEKRL